MDSNKRGLYRRDRTRLEKKKAKKFNKIAIQRWTLICFLYNYFSFTIYFNFFLTS